jgi:hypothetical protein
MGGGCLSKSQYVPLQYRWRVQNMNGRDLYVSELWQDGYDDAYHGGEVFLDSLADRTGLTLFIDTRSIQ